MKAWIRKWLGLKDTHYMKCSLYRYSLEAMNFEGNTYLHIDPIDSNMFDEGDIIQIGYDKFRVENAAIKISKLENNNDT